MGTGWKNQGKKDGLSVVTSLGETRDGGREVEVDPAPRDQLIIGDFCSLGGIKTDSKTQPPGSSTTDHKSQERIVDPINWMAVHSYHF